MQIDLDTILILWFASLTAEPCASCNHIFAHTVGNKDDNDRKVVLPSDARRLADQVGIPFFETSAKENKNVEEVGLLQCDL